MGKAPNGGEQSLRKSVPLNNNLENEKASLGVKNI